MVWGKTSDRGEQRRLDKALTDRLRGPQEIMRSAASGRGSRGGAPIWTMQDVWMPDEDVPFVRTRNKKA